MITFQIGDIEIYAEDVIDAVESAERLGLKIVGFETRADMMRSIVRGPSQPGQPPRDKTGDLRRNINYGLDGKSVVIGPRLLPKKSKDVTSALERGGISFDVNGKRHYIERRPLAGPSLDRIARRMLPGVFLDSVKAKG